MTATPCCVCGRPTADGYADSRCAQELAQTLSAAAGHAEDAEAVIARQTRYGAGSRGGSGEGQTPDLTKSAGLDRIRTSIGTAVRDLEETTGRAMPPWQPVAGPPCAVGVRCRHASCVAVRTPRPGILGRHLLWLAGEVDVLRKHPAADEVFRELRDTCAALARLVDRPADKDLVGMCDCGKVLYAEHGKAAVTCPVPTCRMRWNVNESRDILRRSLDGKLVTAAEAARLAAYLDSDRTQDGIRKLIDSRVRNGQLVAHGLVDDEPTYVFGEVVLILATIPKRQRSRAA